MIHLLVLLPALAGFGCLALSMQRHQKAQLRARELPAAGALALRLCGYALIALALPVAIARVGTGFGIVAWFGHISLGAGAVFVLLLWRQRRIEARR